MIDFTKDLKTVYRENDLGPSNIKGKAELLFGMLEMEGTEFHDGFIKGYSSSIATLALLETIYNVGYDDLDGLYQRHGFGPKAVRRKINLLYELTTAGAALVVEWDKKLRSKHKFIQNGKEFRECFSSDEECLKELERSYKNMLEMRAREPLRA